MRCSLIIFDFLFSKTLFLTEGSLTRCQFATAWTTLLWLGAPGQPGQGRIWRETFGRFKGPEITRVGGARPYRHVGPGDSRVPRRERSTDIHDSGFVFPQPPPAPTPITRAYTYIHSCLGGFVATARQRG